MNERGKGEPHPIRLFEPERTEVRTLKERHGFTKTDIIRRCLYFALPKFLSGEVDISRVVAAEKPINEGGKK